MPSYTCFPAFDVAPNTATPVPFFVTHATNVDDNDAASGYNEFALNNEEWYAFDITPAIPTSDTVTAVRLRITSKDTDANSDTLQLRWRMTGVADTLLETVIHDASPNDVETVSASLSPLPSRTQLSLVQGGVKCTAQFGNKVRLGYMVLQVETTAHPDQGPIIAGDEDATTM